MVKKGNNRQALKRRGSRTETTKNTEREEREKLTPALAINNIIPKFPTPPQYRIRFRSR
jgi:hypothetical protein